MKGRKPVMSKPSTGRRDKAKTVSKEVLKVGKRRKEEKRQSRHANLLERVAETKKVLELEKKYGSGLSNMSDIHAAVEAMQKEAEEKALRVHFAELAKELGKTTLTQRGVIGEETLGMIKIFSRWEEVRHLSLSDLYKWASERLEADAKDRSIKLEKYQDLKASVKSGKSSSPTA